MFIHQDIIKMSFVEEYVKRSNVEIEAKFKNTDKSINIHLLNVYSSKPSTSSITTDKFINKERYSFTENGVFLTTKNRLKSLSLTKDILVHISTEKLVEIEPRSFLNSTKIEKTLQCDWEDASPDEKSIAYDRWSNFFTNIDFERKKERISIRINDYCDLDITTVNTLNGCNSKTAYECELEIINKDCTTELFKRSISEINSKIREYYVIKEWNEWTSKIYRPMKIMDSKVSTSPRSIIFNDLKYGGLIDGKAEYSITKKSDGERRYLQFSNHGIFLVKPKRPYPIIEVVTLKIINGLIGTIIDGELIDNMFIGFDVVTVNKSNEIQKLDHLEGRLPIWHKILTKIDSINKLMLKTKSFFRLGNSLETIRDAFDEVKDCDSHLEIENDGYIITPINWPYKVIKSEDANKWDNRSLLDSPDIVKVKPYELSTIDFYIMNGEAYVLDQSTGKNVKFKGTQFTPFNQSNLRMNNIEELNNKVIEFLPINMEDERPVKMAFYRYREDKDSANSLYAANSVWKSLHEPLTVPMILGYKFIAMRKYFNSIKEEMFRGMMGSNLKNELHTLTLLDIGSGRGSDISKIVKSKHFNRIVGVEPNHDNAEEYRRRMDNINLGGVENIALVECGGEDTNKIIEAFTENDKNIIASSMLSLSFFFSNEDTLLGLARTFKELDIHTFIFMTIEGKRLDRILNKYKKCDSKEIKLGPVDITDTDDGTIIFDFPDTIVGRQYEWRVDLEKFADILNAKSLDYYDIDTTPKKGSYIMSGEERDYCSMYVYGIMTF